MKTYLFPEVAGHGEITEWVPADVARELFEALQNLGQAVYEHMPDESFESILPEYTATHKALAKAKGEQ